MIDWLVARLREGPERAFVVPITLGCAIGRLRAGTFALGLVTPGIPFCMGAVIMTTPVLAQTASASPPGETSQLLPADRQEIADQERLSSWTVNKIPPQPYMKEVYWNLAGRHAGIFPRFPGSVRGATYDLTRDNANGTRSQAWAAGGWLAFRSGLVGDIFGVHAAYYTSQKLYAPLDEGGTRLLAPGQNSIGTLGQIYGRAQFGDQEFRGGYQLVDTPLINPQDNRMVPNTFGGITLDSLPDKDRNYDYALGYLCASPASASDIGMKSFAVNHGAAFGMVKWRPISGLSTVCRLTMPAEKAIGGSVAYDFGYAMGLPGVSVGAWYTGAVHRGRPGSERRTVTEISRLS